MSIIVRYKKDMEPAVQRLIDEALAPWLWLLPGWVQRVSVVFRDGKKLVASVKCHYDYRTVKLTIYSAWINQPVEDRQEQIVHELVHIPLSLIFDYARDKFDLLCPHDKQEQFNDSIHEDLRVRHEAATQDLAKVIFDKFRTENLGGSDD